MALTVFSENATSSATMGPVRRTFATASGAEPMRPAEFAVGDHLEPQPFLPADDPRDGLVFLSLDEFARPQQATDMLGSKRRRFHTFCGAERRNFLFLYNIRG